jgi:ankyrin repeat protein
MASNEAGSTDLSSGEEEELLLPPNLIWKIALIIHSSGAEISSSRDSGRFKIMFHRVKKMAFETYHVNFRDFQTILCNQMSKLPDPYEYLDHIGSYHVQDKCLFLETHFTSEKQIKRCLEGIAGDGAVLAEKINSSFQSLMGAREMFYFKMCLVVCSSIDQKYRFVTDDNCNYAFELVYTPNPAFATFHVQGKALYKQMRKAYDELLKLFPGFFGGMADEILSKGCSATARGPEVSLESVVTDRELADIAEDIDPRRWKFIGTRLGLDVNVMNVIEVNNPGNVSHAILEMLSTAKMATAEEKDFRKILALALYESHYSHLAIKVNPSLDISSLPTRCLGTEEESSKLYLVHGDLKFYDKGLAEHHLNQVFWSATKDILPIIGEKLTQYSMQTGLVGVGSLRVQISMFSFGGCLRLTRDIASNVFVENTEMAFRAIGYEETLIVEFRINGVDVTPGNCYELYLQALRAEIVSHKRADTSKQNNEQGKPMKFKKSTNSRRSKVGQPSSVLEAIKCNNLSTVKHFLSHGANPNECTDGYTPLHTTALVGSEDFVEILVLSGGKIEARAITDEKYTPLHVSAHNGNMGVTRKLVDLGAEVDSRSSSGKTPLRLAAAEGFANIAEFLLSKGADPNTQDSVAATPLHVAAGLSRRSVVSVLINSGADIAISDDRGCTPVHEAIKTENIELLRLVLSKNPSVVNEMNFKAVEPPLTAACKLQSFNVAEFLLTEVHANPNVENKDHLTPLALACTLENIKLIELLIEHGAAPTEVSSHFGSVLHLSAKDGKVKAMQKLLKLGVPCDLTDNDGYTPLRDALLNRQHEAVTILLEAGASVHAGTPPGKLPLLHVAARNNDVQMLEILVSHNCDIYETPADGSTALHHAASCAKSEAIHFLCSQTQLLNVRSIAGLTPLYTAVRQRNFDSTMEILVYNPDVNICSHNGHSPLLICIDFNGPLELVEQFMFHKAKIHYKYEVDINGRAVDLKSPIQLACRKAHEKNVKVLLEANPDFLRKSSSQLHHLLLFSAIESGSVKTLQVLLDHGIDPNALTNNESLSALVKACVCGSVEMLRLLLEHGADPTIPTGDVGITPLIVACEHDKVELVECLVTRVNVNQQMRSNGYSALHKIASAGNPDIALLLLDNGAHADIESHNGLTPLHIAASAGNLDIIDILLQHKANLDAQDHAQTTPLMRAVQDGHHDAATKIIEAGGSLEIRAITGIHVLHFAAFLDDVKTIKLLSEKRVSLDVQDDNGTSPLHIAAMKGNFMATEALLSCGSSANILNEKGFSPLHLAVCYDYVEIAELLIENGASIELTVEGNAPASFSKSQKMDQLLESEKESKVQLKDKATELEVKTEKREDTVMDKNDESIERRPVPGVKAPRQVELELNNYKEEIDLLFSAC